MMFKEMQMRSVVRIVALVAGLLTGAAYHDAGRAATLLPNGEQTFLDQNGRPIASGCVYFYTPGTFIPKDTYVDPGAVTANTNPVVLDAAGRAIIYGVGTYRQVVKKSPCGGLGEQVWDQLTADTASSSTIFAGASAGTPNAITVNAPSFTGVDGTVVNYISTNTNTSAATFNPSGFGSVPILRDSQTGPAALVGGELVATNAVSLMYDANAGVFHIMSPVTWPNASGAGVPVGSLVQVAGYTAPTGYAFAYGQAVNRVTYSALMGSLTSVQNGSITNASPIITGLTDTTQFGYGTPVESVGISTGTIILRCTSTTCTMNGNASVSRTGDMTFFSVGSGDGATTFNLPDMRGMLPVGRDNMGGTGVNVSQVATTITTTSASATATVGSAAGLAVGMYVSSDNVVGGTRINAISGTTLTLSIVASGSGGPTAARFSALGDAYALGTGGGSISHAQSLAEMAAHDHGGAPSPAAHSHGLHTNGIDSQAVAAGGATHGLNLSWQTPAILAAGANSIGTTDTTALTIASAGSGNAMTTQNPARIVNYAIRLLP